MEAGTHNELLAKKGAYADLVRAQELKTKNPADKDAAASNNEELIASPSTIASKGESVVEGGEVIKLKDIKGKKVDEDDVPVEERERREMERIIRENKTPLLRILGMQRPELGFVVLAFFVSAINGAILPLFGVLFGRILPVFGKRGTELFSEVAVYCYLFLGLMGLNFIINFLQFGCFGAMVWKQEEAKEGLEFRFIPDFHQGERLTRRIRYQYFKSMLRQDGKFFDDKMNGTGALTARLSEDADKIQGLTGPSMGSIVQLLTSLSVALGISFYYSWKMTLIVLVRGDHCEG